MSKRAEQWCSKDLPNSINSSPVSQSSSLTSSDIAFRRSPFSILRDPSDQSKPFALFDKANLQPKLRAEMEKVASKLMKNPLNDFDLWANEGIDRSLLEKQDFVSMCQMIIQQEKEKAKKLEVKT